MEDIKSKNLSELASEFEALGLKKYRASQVFMWLNKGVQSFDEMTNINNELKAQLKDRYYIANASIERKLVSKKDETVKYLFSFDEHTFVEAVVMKYHHGYTMCISTQAGCKMGCTFCATGKGGFKRNLTPSEMLSQIQKAQLDLGIRISNIVLMGMGEPLDNYDNVLKFLRLVSSPDGLNIGMRHISLSTCGLVDKIYELEKEKLGLTLSVSLHAPNDEIRSKTMPVNQKWNIDTLLKACRHYADATKRRISFEYAMIENINDSDKCANELGRRLKGMLCHVNLIPVNSVKGTSYRKSGKERCQEFINILSKYGITATVRRTLGSDINASCGQLAGQTAYREET